MGKFWNLNNRFLVRRVVDTGLFWCTISWGGQDDLTKRPGGKYYVNIDLKNYYT